MSERAGTHGRKDLRSYLTELEGLTAPSLVRVPREVDPVHELSAVVKALEGHGTPAVYFERVKGSTMPVVSGLFGTRDRIALALERGRAECVEWFIEALANPIDARVVDAGPVQEVRMVGEEVDLGDLPIGVHSALDGGRYLSSGCVMVRDPATDNVNLGMYRMKILDRNHVAIRAAAPHDLAKVINSGSERHEPIDFAIVIGHHPAVMIASQAKNAMTLDAFSLAGALLGQSLELTQGLTVDLNIPAYAEIVLEGRIHPWAPVEDGPFGEFTYYYGANSGYQCEITAVTRRQDAIFLDLHPTHPEHSCLWIFPGREARMLQYLRNVVPSVRAVHIPIHGAGMIVYISIDKLGEGEPRRALLAALTVDNYIKHAVIVDSDVDVFDDRQVIWALNLRFQGDRDMIVLPNSTGVRLDPTSYTTTDRFTRGGLTTKVGFDATVPLGVEFPVRADLPPAGYETLDLASYLASG